jgi:phage shock protein C
MKQSNVRIIEFAEKVRIMEKREKSNSEGPKRLYRSKKDRKIAGVCGGVAEFFNIDPVIVRIIWVLSIFLGGIGILGYLIAWIIVPINPNQ